MVFSGEGDHDLPFPADSNVELRIILQKWSTFPSSTGYHQ